MSCPQKSNHLEINVKLASKLIAEQFPQWAHLPIKPVEVSGHDNRTFRLGDRMSLRLPSAHMYASKVQIEQQWLPFLAPHLSFSIPQPIALGKPSKDYPWHWSIYAWIEGKSANILHFNEVQLKLIASDLAQFLHELHKINTTGAPVPGSHNFYRGASPAVYDDETKAAIIQLKNLIDVNTVTRMWEKALSSQWNKKPVWIHGDFSAGNILIQDNHLIGVIDFGGMCVGDPACDLVIAWTFLNSQSRKIFKEQVNLDSETWARARGWALWKALITLTALKDIKGAEANKQLHIINEVIKGHAMENC